jgi:hypothetical protein
LQGFTGTQGVQGTVGAGLYTYSATAPSTPSAGDRWVDSDTGILYTYVNDGDSSAWIDFSGSGYAGANGIGSVVPMVSGYYYRPAGSNSSVSPAEDRVGFLPLFVPTTTTFDRMAIRTGGTFSGSGVVRLGIYSDSNGVPGSLVLDAGTVATSAASTTYEITISQTVAPGLYWLAFCSQTNAATNNYVSFLGGYNQFATGTAGNGTSAQAGWYEDAITGALPSTAAIDGIINNFPQILMRVA